MNNILSSINLLKLDSLTDKSFLDQIGELQSHFVDPPDSLLLKYGISTAVELAHQQSYPKRVLDLGAGISLISTDLLKEHVIDAALSIEINPTAVKKGQDLATRRGVYKDKEVYQILIGDIKQQSILNTAKAFNPTIIAGNLPYMPDSVGLIDPTRDAGPDGTNYINLLLEYAMQTNAPFVSFNFASLTTPDKLLPIIGATEYSPIELFVIVEGFGPHSPLLLKTGVIDINKGHLYRTDKHGKQHQLMMNVVLAKNNLGLKTLSLDKIGEMIHGFVLSGKVSLNT